MNHVVLDAGAIIGMERRERRVIKLLERALEREWTLIVPPAVIAETWRGARTDAIVARFLKTVDSFAPLDREAAMRIGSLLASADLRSGAYVVDASVVDVALKSAPCLLAPSDAPDIRRLIDAAQTRKRIEIFAI